MSTNHDGKGIVSFLQRFFYRRKSRRALVIAHFNKSGRLRTDTLGIINESLKYFEKIILVSTNLAPQEKLRLPDSVECHVRENTGYDFYSYRHGIKELQTNIRQWENFDQITLMNTSFLCVDPEKFLSNYINEAHQKTDFDFIGLTKSNEINLHLQTFLITFSKNVIQDDRFIEWWNGMVPLNERQQVIYKYEIGLSQFLIQLGYKLKSVHQEKFSSSGIPNPSHADFIELLWKYGIIKIEIIKQNPFKLNLTSLNETIKSDENFKKLIMEGLDN